MSLPEPDGGPTKRKAVLPSRIAGARSIFAPRSVAQHSVSPEQATAVDAPPEQAVMDRSLPKQAVVVEAPSEQVAAVGEKVAVAGVVGEQAPRSILTPAAEARLAQAAPKKRRIELLSDRADALQRVEAGEVRRAAPTPAREPASGYVPPPVQANGTTPADRAIRHAEHASSALAAQQYHILKHFVVLAKRTEQSVASAVVAEAALALAHSGRF